MRLKIYILLPVYNRLEQTKKFIECLLAQTYDDYHLILMDDGSTDGTAEYVSAKVNGLTIITGRGEWFWGGGLHQGYLWLKRNKVNKDDIVLIMNNDTEFQEDFLAIGASLFKEKSQTLFLAQGYERESGKLVESGVHVDWKQMRFQQAKSPDEINCLSTRGLFLRVGDFFDIGDLHPFLLPHYGSDYEFTMRAYRKGYRLASPAQLKLTVDEGTTGYHDFKENTRRWDFIRKYFSKRSAANPVYWLFFIALACPWPWKLFNLLRVMYRMCKIILGRIFIPGGAG